MPELAIAEHSNLLSDKGHAWFTRNIFDIFAVTKSAGSEFLSKFYFDFSIL